MYNKYIKTIIEALKWDRVYIIKYIIKSFNEFALISVIYILHSKTVFSVTALNVSSYI